MNNIYTDFFNGVVTVLKAIGTAILFILVILVQLGIFLFSTAITLLFLKWILDMLGINLGISF